MDPEGTLYPSFPFSRSILFYKIENYSSELETTTIPFITNSPILHHRISLGNIKHRHLQNKLCIRPV